MISTKIRIAALAAGIAMAGFVLVGCASGGTTMKPAASPPTASQSTPESMVGGGTGGGAHGGGTAQPGTPQEAPNPVDLLRKIPGIQLPAGVSVGDIDAYGDRYASGNLSRGEHVTVYTNVSDEAVQANGSLTSTDSNKIIVGPKFTARYVGVNGDNGIEFSIDPAQMATWLGGQLR